MINHGDPNELIAQIHTRLPVVLREEHHAKWLGEVEDAFAELVNVSEPPALREEWAP
jgi:putative SOS response-associated peptidase YedK